MAGMKVAGIMGLEAGVTAVVVGGLGADLIAGWGVASQGGV